MQYISVAILVVAFGV